MYQLVSKFDGLIEFWTDYQLQSRKEAEQMALYSQKKSSIDILYLLRHIQKLQSLLQYLFVDSAYQYYVENGQYAQCFHFFWMKLIPLLFVRILHVDYRHNQSYLQHQE